MYIELILEGDIWLLHKVLDRYRFSQMQMHKCTSINSVFHFDITSFPVKNYVCKIFLKQIKRTVPITS